ncbi:MAG: hypothetical protein KDD37_10280 [Bdellovibrionales bacterium]|nr:hypothetical protein [Bdellovibrionales bacterium]
MLFWVGLFISSLFAEYRVHKLAILDPAGQKVKEVTSTLDDLQYGQYFEVPQNYHVQLLDSWKCYEFTGDFKPHCQNPKEAGRLPSSAAE